MLIPSIHNTLNELSDLLSQLSADDYTFQCSGLSNATIGEHTRHIIELFQCLMTGYETGIINYDNRNRNYLIESNIEYANQIIDLIICDLEKPNKNITLEQFLNGELVTIETNYFRELLYNLEHCIHHQALIKVALYGATEITISSHFGVAPSTIAYRKSIKRELN